MAGPKSRSRESSVRPEPEEARKVLVGEPVGEPHGTARGEESPQGPPAELQPPRDVGRGVKRQLAIIRGSSALGTEIRLREHIRTQSLEDVLAFLKTLMDAGAEDPKGLGHLGFEAAKLLLDKLTGYPQSPYDEQEAMGVAVMESSLIEKEAQRVVKQLKSQPLEEYLEVTRSGALPAPGGTDGPRSSE